MQVRVAALQSINLGSSPLSCHTTHSNIGIHITPAWRAAIEVMWKVSMALSLLSVIGKE